MEDVFEEIAANVGVRWRRLYALLGLDPRGRYLICLHHESEPNDVQHHNCALEMLHQWRQINVVEEDKEEVKEGEREALKKLTSALRISGCKELAERLCKDHGKLWESTVVVHCVNHIYTILLVFFPRLIF